MKQLFLILIILMSGCAQYSRTISDDVFVRKHETLGYSIQFTFDVEGRGNIHNLFSFKKYKYQTSEWIYLPLKAGVFDISNLIYSPYYNCTKSPWVKLNYIGNIKVDDTKLIVDLLAPRYDKEVLSHRVSAEINGEFNLIFTSVPYELKPSDKSSICYRGENDL